MTDVRVNAVDVIADRQNGLTCRECAEKYGVPEHAIWNLMRATGNAGKWTYQPSAHAKPTGRASKPLQIAARCKEMIEHALDMRDEMTIERGLSGDTYIVTIGEHTGREERDLNSAIRSAFRRLEV